MPCSEETKLKLSKSKMGQIAWNKGLTNETDERVKKNSKTKSGFVHTEEAKKKMSESMKGHIPWNKGIPWSEETKEKIRISKMGTKCTQETKEKMSKARSGINNPNYGKPMTRETKRKLSKAKIGMNTGESNCNWKGGITPLNHSIRTNYKYRQWRDDVFTRDDFTCQECGEKGCYLHAHHIETFSSIIQKYEITSIGEALECAELWNINNGITLCKECHKELHKKVI